MRSLAWLASRNQNREARREGQAMKPEDDRLQAHAERLRQALPNATDFQIGWPIGTLKPSLRDTIFPLLDQCGGVAIGMNSNDELGRTILYGAGMPEILPRVDICVTAGIISNKLTDFAFHAKGILADPQNPDIGTGGWVFRHEHPQTKELFIIHVWHLTMYLRDSTASLCALYSSGINPSFTYLTRMRKGAVIELYDVNPNEKEFAHRLIDHSSLLVNFQETLDVISKRNYITRTDEISPEVFRVSLIKWAKRLGERGGKPRKIRFQRAMNLDAKTFKKYCDREQGLWEEAVAVFEDTRLD